MSLSTSQQILENVKKSKKVLVVMKKNPDIDTLCAGLGLCLYLKRLEKNTELICQRPEKKQQLEFLGNTDLIKPELEKLRKFIINLDISKNQVEEFSYDVVEDNLKIFITPKQGSFSEADVNFENTNFKFDLIFTINTPDLEDLGDIYDNNTEFFYNTPIINLDYKPNNEHFGQINLVELTATSGCEVVFDIIEKIDTELIDEDISTSLLTGIIANTKSFKTEKVTPKALSTASQLIAFGADRSKIINELYQTRSINTLQLWGRALSRLNTEKDYKIVWSMLTAKDFEITDTTEDNLLDIIDELIAYVHGVEIIFLLFEQDNKIKGILKTEKNHNAFTMTKRFKPQGTRELVRFTIENSSLKEAEQQVIKTIPNFANFSD